jgi:hypothetical protein
MSDPSAFPVIMIYSHDIGALLSGRRSFPSNLQTLMDSAQVAPEKKHGWSSDLYTRG